MDVAQAGRWGSEMLAAVGRAYREDPEFVEAHEKRDAQREEALPRLRDLAGAFADGRTDLDAFRHQLGAFALDSNHLWGFNNFGMMTVNQLAKGAAGDDEDEIRAAVRVPATAGEAGERPGEPGVLGGGVRGWLHLQGERQVLVAAAM